MLNRLKELFLPDTGARLNPDRIAAEVGRISSDLLGNRLHGVFQYGSTVYGKPEKDSDIDLIVVTKTPTAEQATVVKTNLLRAFQEEGLPSDKLHITVVTEEEFTQYPPIHPSISAALMRGKIVKTNRDKR